MYVRAGKNWHETKKPFRPTAGLTSYQKRLEERKAREAMKEKEKEMKEEKEAERQVRLSERMCEVWMVGLTLERTAAHPGY